MSEVPKAKVVLAGPASVGKTAIITRYCLGKFDPELNPTIGANFVQTTITTPVRTVNAEIWDTAGQEIYKSLTSSFFNDANCAILVYDISSMASLEDLDIYVNMAKDMRGNDCLYAIVGNKGDLEDKREVSFAKGAEYAKKVGAPLFFESSAKNGSHINDLFSAIASSDKLQFYQTPKVSLPAAEAGKKKKKCCQ